ncbi:hypothetical protein ACPCBX_22820 [Streptomyces tuirus]|uniref:Lipoprotein n=1 Tax=Streptomyces tuirus TaxID=68278 RepID=A0A7G1NGH4_9ACTN|nr:hypothetical protein [Streptomyces tuirus]BCL22253.1 hypothetical protein GCM10017668_40960 [Streptomyces tuirus]
MLTTRRRVAAACLLAAVTFSAAGCSSDSDDGSSSDEIVGAGGGGKESPSSSASVVPEEGAPTFDLPSDVKAVVENEQSGDATKDAILRDVAYSAQARLEAFGKGSGRTANMNRYFAASALTYWTDRIAAVKEDGLTVSGDYRYFGFEVTDVTNGKTAAVRYCEDQSKGYSKEISTKKVLRTQPSDKDFILYTLQAARDARGDWQVQKQSWKKGDASCVQG